MKKEFTRKESIHDLVMFARAYWELYFCTPDLFCRAHCIRKCIDKACCLYKAGVLSNNDFELYREIVIRMYF